MGLDRKEGNLFGYPGSKDGDDNPLATVNDKHSGKGPRPCLACYHRVSDVEK
jgi:hypothetical protein